VIHVEHVMGTVVSIDVRDPHVPAGCVEEAVERLHDVDRRFSTYRADSEVSRLARGDIALQHCSDDLRDVLEECERLRVSSDGAFDVRYGGWLDPSGYVKGWAVDRAAEALWAAGVRNAAINAGGDALVRGEPEPGRPWRVGVRHPDVADKTAAVIGVRDGAIATSGLYERGDHILDPRTGRAPGELVSVTVIAPTLAQADSLATAAFVMGERGIPWVLARPGCEVFAVTADRRVRRSAGVPVLPTSIPSAAGAA
jgi:FAD:protein FMN transferase